MTTFPNQEGPAVTETTPQGTSFERVYVTLGSGDGALLVAPVSKPLGSTVTMVIGCHGHDGSRDSFQNSANYRSIRDPSTDEGWVFIAPHMHGNQWGNQVAMDDLASAYAYVSALWNVEHVLLFGGSMGGLTVTNALARNVVPKVRGMVAVAPALNLASAYANSSFTNFIRAAYGIATDGSDYATKTAGFDPLLGTPDLYAGRRVRMYHSPGDGTITKTANSDVFVSKGLHSQMAEYELRTMTGGHLEAGNYDAPDTMAFFRNALNPSSSSPESVGVRQVSVWDGSGWKPSVPKVWAGGKWVTAPLTATRPQ